MGRIAFPGDLLPSRARHLAAFTMAAALLGTVAGAQSRALESRPTYTTRYTSALTDVVYEMQREQSQLKGELARLRAQLDVIQERAADFGGEAARLQSELQPVNALAGMTPLTGSGVIVTLDDAKLPATMKDVARAIIHSQDVTDIINAGWQGGADAIAVNGERITASSACVGATIQINGTLMSPPYVLRVIGPTDALLRMLTTPEVLSELKSRRELYGLRFEVKRADDILVPAFSGPLPGRYAHVR